LLAGLVSYWPGRCQADPAPPPSICEQLQPFVDDGTIPGCVVLIASKDKVLDVETVGYADIARKAPMAASRRVLDCVDVEGGSPPRH